MSDHVHFVDVSMRDGLQNESVIVATGTKLEMIGRLVRAGVRDIEVTSFVRPRWIPQLADATEVVSRLPDVEDVRFWALVPNRKGLDRALESGIGNVATFLSASETHNKKNVNRTVRESLSDLRRVVETASAEGLGVRSYISTVFGCPYEGKVPVDRSVGLALDLLDAGADYIVLGDTIGAANPAQVKEVIARMLAAGVPLEQLAMHFHDTRGMAVANAYSAHQEGIRWFDGALAGVGGCPYAPGATGNAASEDLLYLFGEIGAETGVDLDAMCEAGALLRDVLGRPLPGRLHQYVMAQRASA